MLGAIGGATFFAVATASSVPAPMAGERSPDDLFSYPKTVLSGALSAQFKVPVDKCRRICTERAACKGFDYSSISGLCRLYILVTSAHAEQASTAETRELMGGYQSPVNLAVQQQDTGVQSADRQVPPARTAWMHNGSLMSVVQQNRSDGVIDVRIIYEQPHSGLDGAGIHPGFTLFIGTFSNKSLSGKARLSSKKCGIVEYQVDGSFDPFNMAPFTLKGLAPRRGNDCGIEAWTDTGRNATMRFDPVP